MSVSLVAQMVKDLPAVQETWVWSLAWEDLLEKEMAAHSNGKYSRVENPMDCIVQGLQKVGHDWVTFTSLHLVIGYIPRE